MEVAYCSTACAAAFLAAAFLSWCLFGYCWMVTLLALSLCSPHQLVLFIISLGAVPSTNEILTLRIGNLRRVANAKLLCVKLRCCLIAYILADREYFLELLEQ